VGGGDGWGETNTTMKDEEAGGVSLGNGDDWGGGGGGKRGGGVTWRAFEAAFI
jgi:hypothetical protein